MEDLSISCPKCGGDVKLTESLAAPLIQSTKEEYEKHVPQQHSEVAEREHAITKQWAKRKEQINRVMEATVGMYGELQGIARKSSGEIEGLAIEEDEQAMQA